MRTIRVTIIGTLLLASAAVMTPLTTAAARGGGGGFHGGSGGFHGGSGLGGFHGGGFHAGGFHAGGLGGLHPGGLGGFHSGGISGFHGGGLHSGGVGSLRGGLHAGGARLGRAHAGGLSQPSVHAAHGAFAHGSRGHGPVATRMSSSFSRHGFGRGGFGGRFHRYGVFGWVGPLFWPYAWSDIDCSVFWSYWGYGCADPSWTFEDGDTFWDYGYGDIYGGLFSPFAVDDLASYAPGGAWVAGENGAARTKGGNGAAPARAVAQMCGDDTAAVAGWPIDRVKALVSPDDAQRAALDALATVEVQAARIVKTGCPVAAAFTPNGRLAAMERRIETLKQAVDTVRGPLEAFYGALTDEQKAKFAVAAPPPAAPNSRRRPWVQRCTLDDPATKWPEARIDAALRPDAAQQALLDALERAATQASEELAAACPAEMPATPTGRLAAISRRLDGMLTAIKTVRGPLADLYAGLSDEQKARFNQIGQSNPATPQS